jgi:hypothetical protein
LFYAGVAGFCSILTFQHSSTSKDQTSTPNIAICKSVSVKKAVQKGSGRCKKRAEVGWKKSLTQHFHHFFLRSKKIMKRVISVNYNSGDIETLHLNSAKNLLGTPSEISQHSEACQLNLLSPSGLS